jgi:folate-binding protein YgfZ
MATPADIDFQKDYEAATTGVALWHRSDRAMIIVQGADRLDWLHNLVTHAVRTLSPGEGNYAFALDVRGRILFDTSIWIADDHLMLDVDSRSLEAATQHLDRYIIMEDVQLAPHSATRWFLSGPASIDLMTACGLPSVMAQHQHATVTLGEHTIICMRHDAIGLPGFELVVPADFADGISHALQQQATDQALRIVGAEVMNTIRIERGIPASITELDDRVVPAETRQLDRAVSFQKGCYLGQEVVERMRAHSAVANLLVGMVFDESGACAPLELSFEGRPVGRVTSVTPSSRIGQDIALGFVKRAHAAAGTVLDATGDSKQFSCTVADLPFGA